MGDVLQGLTMLTQTLTSDFPDKFTVIRTASVALVAVALQLTAALVIVTAAFNISLHTV